MNPGDPTQTDRQSLIEARTRGTGATLTAFLRLSGPGWLQGAITLGGGSLAGSLYLGVLGGFSLMWLQPLAMVLGVVMLSAIGYVTLSTGQRPFGAINHYVNPVLGWSWALGSLLASLVWTFPQYSLATEALRQNVLPQLVGPEAMPETAGKLIVCAVIAAISILVIWFYDSGSRGIRIFEGVLKSMVALIVLCFFGVVVKLTASGTIDWSLIARGFIPDLAMLTQPAQTFQPHLAALSEQSREFWSSYIVGQQREVMIAAAATAVGINMTFLLPYSMLRKGWDREFRGLAIFDLATGLLIPFMLVTACVVIASASQFHTTPQAGLTPGSSVAGAPAKMVAEYQSLLAARLRMETGDSVFARLPEQERTRRIENLPAAEKNVAAMLVKRDAFNLADALTPLTGYGVSHYVFGLGVVGMTVSTIIMQMLICGFVVCEMFGFEPKGRAHRLGAMLPLLGALAPFVWSDVAFWLVVPTSLFGMMLIPIAYWSFLLMLNSRSLLGKDFPTGGRRLAWNSLAFAAAGLVTFVSIWSIWSTVGWLGLALLAAFLAAAFIAGIVRSKERAEVRSAASVVEPG